MKTQQYKSGLAIAALFVINSQVLFAVHMVADTQSLFREWHKQEGLKFDLEFDINLLIAHKNSDTSLTATLKYKNAKKQLVTWPAEVKTGGRYRLKVCDFPPLRIKLPKEELLARGYSGHNKFKIVTHCSDSGSGTQSVLAKEYVLYQIYQLLSEYGLHSKMVKITYRDAVSGKKFTRMGILLEDDEEMAERIKGTICDECFGTSPAQIEPKNQLTQALFQYMIGNTDWSVEMNRNLEIITLQGNGAKVLVPYDFDFAGFVNAPYAVPDANYGLKNMRERKFLGQPADKNTVEQVVALYIEKKKAVLRQIERCPNISSVEKADLLQYVESFYAQLESGELMGVIAGPNAN